MNEEFANCPICGNPFKKTDIRTVCDHCLEKDKKDLDIVLEFFRKKVNRTATITEVEDATGISIDTIQRYIREGKIRVKPFPNLWYPCQRCGAKIHDGYFCDICLKEMGEELNHSKMTMIAEERLRERVLEMDAGTYLSRDKRHRDD